MTLELIFFLILSLIAVATALGMLLSRNAIYSALFLVLNFMTVAVFYLLLGAPFIAMAQVTVYAGAIMVLFLFVIMLVHQRSVHTATAFHHQWDIALLLIAGALVVFLYILGTETFPSVTANPDALKSVAGKVVGNTEAVSLYLYRDYLLPFEVASVFLLVAMIGAVVLGRRSAEKID